MLSPAFLHKAFQMCLKEKCLKTLTWNLGGILRVEYKKNKGFRLFLLLMSPMGPEHLLPRGSQGGK
jgi:hypothetical protein